MSLAESETMPDALDKIAVLDFGGQYAHLIAKRIRDLGAYSEILLPDTSSDQLRDFKGIILSGGPASVNEAGAPAYNPEIFKLGLPVLGVCYGHQLMSYVLGGEVDKTGSREDGHALLATSGNSPLFTGLAGQETVWMSHGLSVHKVPPGFDVIGSTADCTVAAMANESTKMYGIQFHAEVTHTPNGTRVYDNFLNIAQVRRQWRIGDFIPKLISDIQIQAGNKNVFMLLSGGVDSTVAFALLNKALGKDRLYGLHVDTGLMRQDESAQVRAALENIGINNFHVTDRSSDFLNALIGITQPEVKRRVIGRVFLEVQQAELTKLKLDPQNWLLGQGTLYPDTIESGGTRHADKIKTHHNRVPEVQSMIEQGRVIEPVADLYKDEVRKVGAALGLPAELVWRHTFPGPGLAVQSLCMGPTLPEVTGKAELEQRVAEIAGPLGLQSAILPIRSVGVQGDNRTYTPVTVLSGVTDWKVLAEAAGQITNRLRAINRVVYLLRPQTLPATGLKIQTNRYLTRDRLDLHRKADVIANRILRENQLERELYEFPVIMIPVGLDQGESIVLRPLYSENVMTVEFAKLPWAVVGQMADAITQLEGVDAVFYDVTSKPPGTVQWE